LQRKEIGHAGRRRCCRNLGEGKETNRQDWGVSKALRQRHSKKHCPAQSWELLLARVWRPSWSILWL